MIRKTLLAAAAVATLAAGALAPTSASAFGWKGHHFGHHFRHHNWGFRHHYWGVRYVNPTPGCFYVKKYRPWGIVIKKVCPWY